LEIETIATIFSLSDLKIVNEPHAEEKKAAGKTGGQMPIPR
jgi:hypothetical protein